MKQLFYALVIAAFIFTGCKGKGGGSQDTPESTAQMIFDAARSGDYSNLKNLCNESMQPDSDSKMICEVTSGDQELRDRFKKYFSKGKVVGSATVDGDKAKVKVMIGEEGDKDEEFNMAKKNGKWYLVSF